MFNNAPVAFLWTLISLDFANRVSGPRAPDLAIFALLSSCVAKFVMQPTALHCTSTFGDIICRFRVEFLSPVLNRTAPLRGRAFVRATLLSDLMTSRYLTSMHYIGL